MSQGWINEEINTRCVKVSMAKGEGRIQRQRLIFFLLADFSIERVRSGVRNTESFIHQLFLPMYRIRFTRPGLLFLITLFSMVAIPAQAQSHGAGGRSPDLLANPVGGPEVGTRYAVSVGNRSNLPEYGLFVVERLFNFKHFTVVDDALWALASVQEGGEVYGALVRSEDPGDPEGDWELMTVFSKELTKVELARSNGIWLAHNADSQRIAFISRDGVDWKRQLWESPKGSIHPTGKGFVSIRPSGRTHLAEFSRDGVSWEDGVEVDFLKDYLQPARFGTFSSSGGWLFHFPYLTVGLREAEQVPVMATQDGKEWYELVTIDKTDRTNSGRASLLVGRDYVVLGAKTTSQGGRTWAFRNGKWETSRRQGIGTAPEQLFDIGGNAFALRTEAMGRDRSGMSELAFTGEYSPSAGVTPEAVIPPFISYDDLYGGESLFMRVQHGVVFGEDFVAGNRTVGPNYVFVKGFQGAPAQSGDLRAILGDALRPLSDRVPFRFKTDDPEKQAGFEELVKQAQEGGGVLQYNIGLRLMRGDDTIYPNRSEGKRFLQSAAETGHGPANWYLYEEAKTSEPDEALDYLLTAVEAGEPDAIFEYSKVLAYEGILGVEPSMEAAAKALEPLAAKQNRKAEVWRRFYAIGDGTRPGQQTKEALRKVLGLIRESDVRLPVNYFSERSIMNALAEVGELDAIEYLFDKAVEANDEEALGKWLPPLANAGTAKGIFYRGVGKVKGILGYEKDIGSGIEDIQAAAEAGFLPAMKDWAMNLSKGTNGVDPDREKAREWAKKVKAAGETDWAEDFLAGLEAQDARESGAGEMDGVVAGLSPKAMQLLQGIQATEGVNSIPQEQFSRLFEAIWWDGTFSLSEEDLVAELAKASSVTLTSESGETLTFEKGPGSELLETWEQYFPTPFPMTNANYPVTMWQAGNTPGPVVYFLTESPVKEEARQNLARALFQDLSKRVQNAQQTGNPAQVTQFNAMLVGRAKAGDPVVGRKYAQLMYSILQDDMGAEPGLLAYFSRLKSFADSPVPGSNP